MHIVVYSYKKIAFTKALIRLSLAQIRAKHLGAVLEPLSHKCVNNNQLIWMVIYAFEYRYAIQYSRPAVMNLKLPKTRATHPV